MLLAALTALLLWASHALAGRGGFMVALVFRAHARRCVLVVGHTGIADIWWMLPTTWNCRRTVGLKMQVANRRHRVSPDQNRVLLATPCDTNFTIRVFLSCENFSLQ